MTNNLTNTDYKTILEFYKKPIPKSKRLLKKQAEDIISQKLCSCIKKIEPLNPKSEARSIGICTQSVVNSKGFKRGTFRCKKKRAIKLYKKNNKTKKFRFI